MSTPLRERPDAPLGTLIFRAGLLPAETIEAALEEGVKTGKRLGEILTERGLISEVDLARLLAGQKGLDFVTLREQIVDTSAASLFTEEQSRLFRALPYAFEGELPVIAIADPTDEVLIRNIREALGRDDARFVVSARGELAEISADVYSMTPAPAPSPEPEATVEPELTVEPEATVEPEPAVEPEATVEPEPEHHGEHTNGSHPVDAEQVLQAPAYEPPFEQQPDVQPEPEPALISEPVAAPDPEAPVFQVPMVEEPPAPEPLAVPDAQPEPQPDPFVEFEPEPAPEPEPPAEPFAAPVPELPAAYETQPPPEPAPMPEAHAAPAPEPVEMPEPPAFEEQPAVPPPLPALEPVAEVEPAPVIEPAAALEPVPMPQPDPAPPAPSYPPAAAAQEPVPAAEPPVDAEPEPAPEPQPGPLVEPVAESSVVWRMTIRLTNGEGVEAGDFSDQNAAKEEAKAIMTQIADADAAEWPFVNGRFLKPDSIVSVDIAELSDDES